MKISKGKPMPPEGSVWPFEKMEIGDSVDVENSKRKNATSSAGYYGRSRNKVFKCRTIKENGIKILRIWRVA